MKVKTRYGTVVGFREGNHFVFKGVPYAKPPVGSLRFSAPTEPDCWEEDLDCDRWPADAFRIPLPPNSNSRLQDPTSHTYSEDCLYLNIWCPECPVSEKLPVMVWLYGGGGSSHDGYLDGSALNEKGCILVSINYRMGILGYFGLEELAQEDPHGSTGAYGIMDIVFALQWVHNNIEAFGGDPGNVTVFGHSAGAMFSKLLLGCKPAWGLFHHIIALSGGGTWDVDVIETKERKCELCQQLLDEAGWTLQDLRTRPVEELYRVLTREESELSLPKKSMLNTLFLPSMDHWLINDYYGKILCEGEVDTSVDVMCGMLVEEWHNFPCQIPGGIGDYKREFALASIVAWGKKYNERGIKPIYTYFFERRMPGSDSGMRHGDELPYVFGTMDRYSWPWTQFDYQIRDTVLSYFTNFAKTGNPNGPGLPNWTPFQAGTETTMHFTENEICCEDISGDFRTCSVVDFLLEHPGVLDDPFPPARGSDKSSTS